MLLETVLLQLSLEDFLRVRCSISRIINLQFDTHLVLKAANSDQMPVGTTQNIITSLLHHILIGA